MKTTKFRGQAITEKDVLSAMERFDAELRETFPEGRWVTYAIRHKGRNYPPKQLMRMVTGLEDVGNGGRPVNARFEDLGFDITMLEEGEASSVGGPEEAEEIRFSLELDLEASLLSNLDQLEKGLKLFTAKGFSGQQVDTRVAGRIDLLATDAKGDFVVIELKAGEADRQVCGQIQAYMGWVHENLAGKRKVRGIVVANAYTPRAVYAARVVPGLTLKQYQFSFRFEDIE